MPEASMLDTLGKYGAELLIVGMFLLYLWHNNRQMMTRLKERDETAAGLATQGHEALAVLADRLDAQTQHVAGLTTEIRLQNEILRGERDKANEGA